MGSRSYRYDAAGNLANKTDREGRVTRYDFDGLNHRVGEEWYATATSLTPLHTLAWSYTLDGKLASAGDAFANYDYHYDDLNRGDQTTQLIYALGSSAATRVVVSTGYDGLSRRTSLNLGHNNYSLLGQSYVYDMAGQLTQLTQFAPQFSDSSIVPKRVDFSRCPRVMASRP